MNASTFIKSSVLWFCVAVTLGMVMGISHDFRLAHVHAHLNLLGWVSQILIGVTWHLFPQLWSKQTATVAFVMYNAGAVLMMSGLSVMLTTGSEDLVPVVGAGSSAVVAAIFVFAYHVIRKLRAA